MERDGTGRNGKLKPERKGTRWNGEGSDGTERLEGAERLEETKRNQMERRGIRWNEVAQDGTEGTS